MATENPSSSSMIFRTTLPFIMVYLLFLLISSRCPQFHDAFCSSFEVPRTNFDRGWYFPGQHGLHVGTPQHRGVAVDVTTLKLAAGKNYCFIH